MRSLLVLSLALASCQRREEPSARAAPLPTPSASVTSSAVATPPPRTVTLLAGGDIDFGRAVGRRILREPGFRPLGRLSPLFETADLVFANLECPLSDQGGEVVKPWSPLVFNAPKEAAPALAPIHVVSTANNHVWDYGEAAALETLERLERAGIAHVGLSRSTGRASEAVVVERGGVRFGFVALTEIWNQGPISRHPARDRVAHDPEETLAAIRAVAPAVDVVIVSHHAGEEYRSAPLPALVALRRRFVDAGAHVVLGHHPHVPQRVEVYRGRPIFHSLGNLAMQMNRHHPATEHGLVARVTIEGRSIARVEACVIQQRGLEPEPVTSPAVLSLLAGRHGLDLGADGCGPIHLAFAEEAR